MISTKFKHVPTGQVFVVKQPAGDGEAQVLSNLDGKPQITKDQVVQSEAAGVQKSDLVRAAKDFNTVYQWPAPGTRFPPAVPAGLGYSTMSTFEGRLNRAGAQGDLEFLGFVNAKQQAALDAGKPLAVGRSAISRHLDVMDFQRKGELNLADNYRGWRSQQFGPVSALIKTAGSALVFGSKSPFSFGTIDIEAIDQKRPAQRTGVFDGHGQVDRTLMNQYLLAFDAHSKDGEISHEQCEALVTNNSELSRVSKAQWQSFFEQCKALNHRDTVTKEQFIGLFDGTLGYVATSVTDSEGKRTLDRFAQTDQVSGR